MGNRYWAENNGNHELMYEQSLEDQIEYYENLIEQWHEKE